jgi:hypothetical protein
MTRLKASAKWIGVLALVLVFSAAAMAQTIDGTLRGTVTDPSGAVISGAKVTATNTGTGLTKETTTTSSGTFNFPNMLVGNYTVTVEGSGFKKYTREQVQVRSNQIAEVDAKLAVGAEGTTVEVSAGAEVIQTDSQLVNTFDANQIVNLPINSPAGVSGVLNLAILAPGTTTQGGGVLGQGGSIGGARPRMNNFTVDGLDDNRVDITGPQSNVISDSIAEFTLITNQFSAEQGHSAGGQFNIVTKSGTNNWHGTAGIVNNNRHYNAFDNVEKLTQGCDLGPCEKQRTDFNQISGTLGGPLVKNKLFIFGAYQRVFAGFEGGSAVLEAPTAAGLTNLNTLAQNAAVREILAQFPVASSSLRTINVTNTATGTTLPVAIGEVGLSAPSFYNEHDYQVNGDLNLSKHQIRMRYLNNRQRSPNLSDPPVPQFSGSVTFDVHKAALTDVWSITNRLVNDFRLGYTRQLNGFTVPATFANFPNVFVNELTNFQVGPEGNSPQGGGQNVYQIVEQMTYSRGGHTLKFGGEGRRWIAPGGFLPRARGEWQYSTLQNLVNDFVPNDFAKRGAGSGQTDGNQTAFFWFFQDDWKVNQRLTLNLGVRYEWFGIPNMLKTQSLNAIADCPTCISQYLPQGFIFRTPKSDINNYAPRLGFAWDPTGSGKWSIRGGFGISYDVIAQNFPSLQLPPQLQSEQDPDITCALPGRPAWCATYTGGANSGRGFLAGGGLLQVNVPPANQAEARAATQGVIFDQVQPKVYTWTGSIQRELWKNTSVELRYLGTRGAQLFAQTQLNARSGFDNGGAPLPTYFSNSAVPTTFAAGSPTLAAFNTASTRPFAAQGFAGSVTGFTTNAESIYHSGSIDLNQRMTRGLSFRANYTWAHNIDNGTNELFSSLVNPRRAEDGNHQERERGRSVLDIRHKGAVSWVYELPKSKSDNGFVKALVNGWMWNGTYLVQSGQPVTAQSATDSNGNKDSAGDRAILNPAGDPRIGTDVNFVCWNGTTRTIAASCASAAETVGYVAINPNAGYVRARTGALTNVGRNTLTSPGRNNWDMSVFKNTYFTEKTFLQFRVEMFNVFNHRQFSFSNPGVFSIPGIDDSAINAAGYARVADPNFLDPKQLNGTGRTIQLGLKFVF